jgi:signal transduction histidine kinase
MVRPIPASPVLAGVRKRRVPSALLVMVGLTVCFGIYAEWAFARAGASSSDVVRDLLVGWTFAVAGVVAWWRQPADRSWVLMEVEAFTWFFSNLQGSGVRALLAAGIALGALNQAVLVHLVLSFPGGRLGSRQERLIVAVAYVLAIGGGLVMVAGNGPGFDPYRCAGCSAGPVPGLEGHPELVSLLDRGVEAVAAVLSLAAVAVIVHRWKNTTAPGREILTATWLAIWVCVLLLVSHAAEAVSVEPGHQTGSWFVWASDLAQLAVPLGIMLVVLRIRLKQAAVGELLLELGSEPRPGRLQAGLAEVLGDVSLRVALWEPAGGAYTDVHGRPLTLPVGDPGRSVERVELEGRRLGAIVHDAALAAEPDLLTSAVAAARLALETRTRHAELQARAEQAEAARARIMEAADHERRRVERDLHDGAQQRLVTLSLSLRTALQRANGQPDRYLRTALSEAVDELQVGLAELRELARGIHPAILTQRGLSGAIESLAARMTLPVETCVIVGRCPPHIEAAAYFAICEALTNVAKHASASVARVNAERIDDLLVVEVSDDGVGDADPGRGTGLAGLHERVAAYGGRLTLTSPPGGGTRLRFELPCA